VTDPLITLLAEGPANTGPDFGKASPVGLLVVVLLLIGVFILVWSMNRHLKRVPQSFDPPGDDAVVESPPLPDPSTADSSTAEPTGESRG
jgi:hypothetical protein